jgi:hypothetical protein
MVETEGGEDDEVEDADAAALQCEPVARATLAQSPADDQQRQRADGRAGESQLDGQMESLVGVLQEERDAEEEDDDADSHDRVAAGEPLPDRPFVEGRRRHRFPPRGFRGSRGRLDRNARAWRHRLGERDRPFDGHGRRWWRSHASGGDRLGPRHRAVASLELRASFELRYATIEPIDPIVFLGEAGLDVTEPSLPRRLRDRSTEHQAGERAHDGADGPRIGVDLVGEQPADERSGHPHGGSSGAARDVDVADSRMPRHPRGTETIARGGYTTSRRLARPILHLRPLELPGRETARMQAVRIQSGRHSVSVEFDLQLHLRLRQQLVAYHTGHSASRTAECTARSSCRQFSALDRDPGLLAQGGLVVHLAGPVVPRSITPDASVSDARLFESSTTSASCTKFYRGRL